MQSRRALFCNAFPLNVNDNKRADEQQKLGSKQPDEVRFTRTKRGPRPQHERAYRGEEHVVERLLVGALPVTRARKNSIR